MRLREKILWTFFLMVCFLVGYLKGRQPETRSSRFWSSPEPVRILVYSEKLVPHYLVKDLEKRTHTQIEIDVSKQFNDFLAHTVTGSDYSLMIIPRFWSEEFKKQNLILSVSGLKNFFQNKLNSDFQSEDFRNFPWAWTTSLFIKRASSKPINSLEKMNLKIIEDDDHIYQVLKKLETTKIKIPTQLSAISLFDEAPELAENDIKEINVFEKNEYGSVEILESWPQSLFIFDIVIPKNTPRQVTSFEILQTLFNSQKWLFELSQEPWALTMNDIERGPYPLPKKPSFLRNQSLLQMIRPLRIESQEKQNYLKKYLR